MRRWLFIFFALLVASVPQGRGYAPEPKLIFQFDTANRLTNTNHAAGP